MYKAILISLFSLSSFASISEADFNNIPKQVLESMSNEITQSGLNIKLNLNWESQTKNAGANRKGNNGLINLYGGYARISEMTKESFAQTTCHELGHLISNGYKVMPTLKYASESEADYFATKTCLKKYFLKYPSNRAASNWQIEKCRETGIENLTLCTDLLIASRDSLKVDQSLTPGQTWKDYTALDLTKTDRTLYNGYATVGCRYTSYIHGALGLDRPSCWLNEKSKVSNESYITDYDYPEAMYVGDIKELKKTYFGCTFKLKSISFFRESVLSPLGMGEVSEEEINVYGNCKLTEESTSSGTISLYRNKLYYNLEARDK
ncbi:ImmA/IrrE family metallo-endopeptidase [Halobacteriovorax sp.]|uniref:ImmA/IrrE family metallo-endopeptidase n=1 Tax=Halobacteriovorax sp. TaxID=2020862 RepID=UPI003569EE53